MKIFGHDWIESERFYAINKANDIKKTPSNALLKIEGGLSASLALAKHCKMNGLRYAIGVESIEEAIFANLLEATYILCEKKLAKEIMPIAQHYLFDTQVLAYIKQDEIEEMAKVGVDGVVIAYR